LHRILIQSERGLSSATSKVTVNRPPTPSKRASIL
jgi:hypothetical protein